jgi:hypothetical protein
MMFPEKIEVEVMEDTTGKWRVFINGACAMRFFKRHNAIDYIEDLKELNQAKEINVTYA